jgi:hypothetical protein
VREIAIRRPRVESFSGDKNRDRGGIQVEPAPPDRSARSSVPFQDSVYSSNLRDRSIRQLVFGYVLPIDACTKADNDQQCDRLKDQNPFVPKMGASFHIKGTCSAAKPGRSQNGSAIIDCKREVTSSHTLPIDKKPYCLKSKFE